MKKLKVYLDTSVISFLFADDAPDLQEVTVRFFQKHAYRFDLFVSQVVVAEIDRHPDPNGRSRLAAVLREHPIVMLPATRLAEVEELADVYQERSVLPRSKRGDALHAAFATVYEMDVLLSWNYKHLANIQREARIVSVNAEFGYRHPLRIVPPLEVLDED